ncbi:hypothetical protein HYW76_05705 [Candidatus Pacearchaeota archaeon]|nr:hypothetical protein [Candidatus Pacearchaeota archaeon]
MDWEECKGKEIAKEASIDIPLINSLIESSKNKLNSSFRLELEKETAGSKLSLAYDSLRELLEALALKKGFKIYNHECFCSFLNEICKDSSSSLEFDRLRIIRNQVNYYGKQIPTKDTEIILQEIVNLRDLILKKYFQ